MPSLPPALRATSLAEGGKDGGYDNPSVALRATPQLCFAAQPSVSTGPPLHKGGFGIPRQRRGGGGRGLPRQSADWLATT